MAKNSLTIGEFRNWIEKIYNNMFNKKGSDQNGKHAKRPRIA